MKKLIIAISLVAAFPVAALAADNVGGCGVGSMVFKGQSGIAPQVLAVTTNGISGNQTFGITSGTLGCTQDGVVTSNMAATMFIETNKEQLARDMSVGSGETLASLAQLLGVEAQDKSAFNSFAKDNMARIFTADSVATEQVIVALRAALASDATLSRYQTAL
ncbi:MAG: DUF3015 domain-containing protein [Gallionella sp.]|nr:DUF3015 domain-containing protein [Gallionella sp.]